MRSVLAHGGYVPYRRLDRAAIGEVMGTAAGRGTRSVASYDEDTTTMGVEAARIALRAPSAPPPDAIWFATAEPAYLEKTNATAIHAALGLESQTMAFDAGGAVRSGIAALRAALDGVGTNLVVASGLRTGLPSSPDEAAGGDGAGALLVGDGPGAAEYLGGASATAEFVDRWRLPADAASRQWEERFAETRYLPLADQAWTDALKATELSADAVDRVAVTGTHARSVRRFASTLGELATVDDLAAVLGHTGAAHPALLLSHVLDTAHPGEVIAVVSLVDGADVLLFRVGEAVAAAERPIAAQIESAGPIGYARFLQWRGMITAQPPNRPVPARPSASAAARHTDWKFGFVGAQGDASGTVHLPPVRVSIDDADTVDGLEPVAMADVAATVVTSTAIVGVGAILPDALNARTFWENVLGKRYSITDVDPDRVAIGDRVEMTFRRLFTADGLHNYFWKARPLRAAAVERGD